MAHEIEPPSVRFRRAARYAALISAGWAASGLGPSSASAQQSVDPSDPRIVPESEADLPLDDGAGDEFDNEQEALNPTGDEPGVAPPPPPEPPPPDPPPPSPPAEPPPASPPAASPPAATPLGTPPQPAPSPEAALPPPPVPPAPQPPAPLAAPPPEVPAPTPPAGPPPTAAPAPPADELQGIERERRTHDPRDREPRVVETPASPIPGAEPPQPAVVQAEAPAPAPPAADPVSASATRISGMFYTVASGDSLWSIAERLLGPGATPGEVADEVQRLWRLNAARIGTGDPSLIHAGVVLRLR